MGKRHKLVDIIVIAICGVICGADDWVMIEYFGNAKEEWFRSFLELPHGIPSHDTFGTVFALIDPKEFQECFIDWVNEIAALTSGQIVAIDGKTVRGSQNRARGKEAIHLVSAWASQNGVVLGQVKVDDKSNEITAIPELLKMLDISGCIVSIDAIGTQKEIVSTILAQKGDYLLAVKQNQGKLYDQIQSTYIIDLENEFKDAPYDYDKKINKDHGRIETRECWVTTDPEYICYVDPDNHWQQLRSLVIVKATRRIGDKTSSQIRYFISSLEVDAKKMLRFVRQHWEVENKLHWSLDVTFRKDDSRVRMDHAPENLALLSTLPIKCLYKKQENQVISKARDGMITISRNLRAMRVTWRPNSVR